MYMYGNHLGPNHVIVSKHTRTHTILSLMGGLPSILYIYIVYGTPAAQIYLKNRFQNHVQPSRLIPSKISAKMPL